MKKVFLSSNFVKNKSKKKLIKKKYIPYKPYSKIFNKVFTKFITNKYTDLLIRKIDSFSEIGFGINRIIGRLVAYKLGYSDLESEVVKEEVLRYIYDKYILNGYYVHGFSSHYGKSILENGFIVIFAINLIKYKISTGGYLNEPFA